MAKIVSNIQNHNGKIDIAEFKFFWISSSFNMTKLIKFRDWIEAILSFPQFRIAQKHKTNSPVQFYCKVE